MLVGLVVTLVLTLRLSWPGNGTKPADHELAGAGTDHAGSAFRPPPAAGTEIATGSLPVGDDWTRRWHQAGAGAEESQRHQAKEALIEALAVVDPRRAIELARGESSEELRVRLIEAALRGWGQTDAEAALAWTATQQVIEFGQAMASLFHGAARDPENAIRLANEMSQLDPQCAADYGFYLVAALAREGEFGKAADFAAGSEGEARGSWLSDVYSRWADQAPHEALAYAAQLTEAKTRMIASRAALLRWAYNDAPALAEYALGIADPNDRRFALSKALPRWAAADPVAAALWVNQAEPSPELDLVAASIATRPEVIRYPGVSLKWAENILEPKLRSRVLASVIHQWANTDPSTAKRYAEESPNIRPEERAAVLSAFSPGFDPISFTP